MSSIVIYTFLEFLIDTYAINFISENNKVEFINLPYTISFITA